MIIDLQLETNEESNNFLRALWNNFREQLGKCAWICMPYKYSNDNKIFLGLMSCNLTEPLSVYVWYKKRGVIDKLEFVANNDEELPEDTQKRINEVVNSTKKSYNDYKRQWIRCDVKSLAEFSAYSSDFFKIRPVDKRISSINIQVECYGEKDGEYIWRIKRKRLLNILSVLTNLPFYSCELNENNITDVAEEVFYEDYIDGYSCKDGVILLVPYAKDIINQILKYNKTIEDESIIKLLSAASHFHAGRKFDAQIFDWDIDVIEIKDEKGLHIIPQKSEFAIGLDVCDNLYEMAVISYISALEVISTIVYPESADRCSQCGQLLYSISRKVKDLLIKYLGEDNGKQVHKYYSSRSKFLHTGHMLSHIYVGVSIPQLEVNSEVGVELIQEVPLLNLREYVGYCIRCVIKDFFINRQE